MGAVPIISAGIGVAGAIFSSSSKRAEEQRQTDLVNAQLSANQQSEAMKYQNITAQRQFLYQNYVTENMQRLQEYRQTEAQFQQEAIKNQAETSLVAGELQNQRGEAQRGLYAATDQVNQRSEQYDNAAASQMYNALAQQAQTNTEAAKVLGQIQQAVSTGDAQLAGMAGTMLANSGGSRQSASEQAALKGQSTDQLAQLLASFSDAQNASQVEIQNIINSEDFSRLLESINNLESGSAVEALNRQFAASSDALNSNAKINDIAFNTNAGALGSALRMAPVNAQIKQNQADMNFLTGNVAIGSEAGQIAAQSLSNQAQLLRSLPPRSSFLNDALGVVSAASPLLQYAMPRQQPSWTSNPISTFKPVIYDVRPTLNTEFYA